MTPRPAGSLLNYLEQVPDPRGRQGLRHPLVAMLATVCCAILSGHSGYEAIAQWIHFQEVSLWHALGFTRRPPTWSCFRDLLMALDPAATTWCWSRTTSQRCTRKLSKPSWSHEAFPPYRKRLAYEARQSVTTTEKNRGRMERRTLTATTVGIDTYRWPGVRQFLRLRREVTIAGETKVTTQYAVTSLSRDQADAARLLRLWRSRWAIENRAFWVRDVVFREDASRIRTGRAPHVLSVVRNSAITLLRGLKVPNLAAALRQHALNLPLLLARLGIM